MVKCLNGDYNFVYQDKHLKPYSNPYHILCGDIFKNDDLNMYSIIPQLRTMEEFNNADQIIGIKRDLKGELIDMHFFSKNTYIEPEAEQKWAG